MRKIIHVDCDCFYAAVEARDDPRLRGRPLAVGGAGRRGVLCTANYAARQFGVHSAMPTGMAMRLCPDLLVVPPDMPRYREVALSVREVFARYTSLIEPLSLDEAFLDVSDSEDFQGSATRIAEAIRRAIQAELGITASAGVAPNKFLAKIASDWQKPDGITVIPPSRVESFMPALPVKCIPGVGPVMAKRLKNFGIHNCADLQAISEAQLSQRFGSAGTRLAKLARGEDDRPVTVSHERKSLSVEQTFAEDLSGPEACGRALPSLVSRLQQRMSHLPAGVRIAGQFVKMKSSAFRQTTVDQQHSGPPVPELFAALMQQAWQRLEQPARLMGVGLRFESHTMQGRQLSLFDL